MEERTKTLVDSCNFMSVKPIMMDLPYPPIQVREENQAYANLLTVDYCGFVSEMSAIMQYINIESRLSLQRCSSAKIMLGIAMAEMIHLQKLGQLILLLGGNVDFIAKYRDGKSRIWTPQYVTVSQSEKEMLLSSIESEKEAIQQYQMHVKRMDDAYVKAVLVRIVQDEEYHIMMLQALLKKL